MEGVSAYIREDGETLPLFIVPKDGNNSVSFLKEWVKKNKSWLKQKLVEHGAYGVFVDVCLRIFVAAQRACVVYTF